MAAMNLDLDLDLDSDPLATSYPKHFTSHVGETGPGLGQSVLQRDWLIVKPN